MKSPRKILPVLLAAGCTFPLGAATVSITAGTYTENFNSMPTDGPSSEPAPGWGVRVNATATTMGTASMMIVASNWADTGGAFRNISSSNIPADSDQATQAANTDRALGLRQVRSGGFNPGAAMCFNFAASGMSIQDFSMDLLQLNEIAARASTFEIQYGFGADPTSFTTLGSWTTDGIFGATRLSFDRSDFGSDLDDESQVWLRIVALNAASGSGAAFDLVALDNFSITAAAVPEPTAALLGALGVLPFLRRRRHANYDSQLSPR